MTVFRRIQTQMRIVAAFVLMGMGYFSAVTAFHQHDPTPCCDIACSTSGVESLTQTESYETEICIICVYNAQVQTVELQHFDHAVPQTWTATLADFGLQLTPAKFLCYSHRGPPIA
ncbi:MAG: hypothetical protein CL946_10025 [Ectothiorhodospiraceae bacterium]|nr:hypothetical protein [Ectothiorhodospiraceae bacterium]